MNDLEQRLRESEYLLRRGEHSLGNLAPIPGRLKEAADTLAAMRESGAELRRTLAIAQGQVLVILNRGDTE